MAMKHCRGQTLEDSSDFRKRQAGGVVSDIHSILQAKDVDVGRNLNKRQNGRCKIVDHCLFGCISVTNHVDTGVSVKELQHFRKGFMGQAGEVGNLLNDRLRIVSLNHELLDGNLLVGCLRSAHV